MIDQIEADFQKTWKANGFNFPENLKLVRVDDGVPYELPKGKTLIGLERRPCGRLLYMWGIIPLNQTFVFAESQ